MSDSFDYFLAKQRGRVRNLLGLPTYRGKRNPRTADHPQTSRDLRQEHLRDLYAGWELDKGLHQFKQGGSEIEVRR